MLKFLSHPNFSLFCFFLNFWFAINGFMLGDNLMFIICTICAAVCFRNYLSISGYYNESR
jgi:hypothetical protein